MLHYRFVMKFFNVILAVIDNYVGQAMASGIYKYDFDVFRNEMTASPNEYIQIPGMELMDKPGKIKIIKDITGDELKGVSQLNSYQLISLVL